MTTQGRVPAFGVRDASLRSPVPACPGGQARVHGAGSMTLRKVSYSGTETSSGIDEQKIDRNCTAIDKNRHIHDQVDQIFRLHRLEQG